MANSRAMEIGVGLFVVIGLAALFGLAMKVSGFTGFSGEPSYRVEARFQNIGGLKVQAPVTMAGVRVGRVAAIDLDERSFEARVQLDIARRFDQLPEDTSASILTSGLLGEQYVGLEPGGMDLYLQDGDEITLTQSALVLEKIIGQFLFQQAEGQ
ncbi:outer membrane lipid asymmetry maintenance protein MlaD [Alkalilimnicola sp. S0819]|uniref:outer membrane lipid asymmetry maintenance protein MlaD n=1 Tax=Alkalilimnicola sp. S0819 TaxID=2613922 RepID=UPI001262739E|nr:outer membrane lipid asymmetry maintenance protein MlaD [Alkalilimnicola sp. S0819]KAB7623829.1 outer membrane lipid asymmetry maintenance protein MlaD [Alkalilimnicola sp. S0819]MPQ16704.1 outer membrane lipid asymmetry maintenance protein MlaD [Alkalilimnicola sp. S0819]